DRLEGHGLHCSIKDTFESGLTFVRFRVHLCRNEPTAELCFAPRSRPAERHAKTPIYLTYRLDRWTCVIALPLGARRRGPARNHIAETFRPGDRGGPGGVATRRADRMRQMC